MMRCRITFFFILTLALFFFTPSHFTHGQLENLGEIPVALEATPAFPEPHQNVTLKVVSYLTNLNSAVITWNVNGKKAESGKGKTTFSTTVGDVGTKSVVTAIIQTSQGDTITKSITLKPAFVALVWESSSYVPPFYKGKALIGPQSRMRIVAIPQFKQGELNNTNYTFTWMRDGRVLSSDSGFGKNTLEISLPRSGLTTAISVSVQSEDGTQVARGSLNIRPVQPEVVVYEYSSLYGTLYNQAVGGTVNLDSKEISFSAVPYFMPAPGDKNTVQFNWTMNDKTLDDTGPVITLRNDNGVKGSTEVKVSAKQTTPKQFTVSY